MHLKSSLRILLLASLLAGGSASAKITLKSYSSDFGTVEVVDPTAVNIFAGNTFNACTKDGVGTCDSCAALSDVKVKGFMVSGASNVKAGLACNNHQIYPTLSFSVTMSSDTAAAYLTPVCAKLVSATTPSSTVAFDPTSTTTTYTPGTANQDITATWTWANLCSQLGPNSPNSAAACENSFTKTLKIGFVSTCTGAPGTEVATFQINFRYVGHGHAQHFGCNTDVSTLSPFEGFCDFDVYPGDGKIYLYGTPGVNTTSALATGDMQAKVSVATPTLRDAATTADNSGIKFKYWRLYYLPEDSFNNFTPATPHHDFEIDESGNIKDRRVQDLENGTPYAFLSASVDKSGNVEYFMDPDGTNVRAPDPSSGTDTTLGKTQGAKPAEVFGLLNNKNCFIATAAYGSGDASDVQTLRLFRNQFLLRSEAGREFVRFYYKVSPPIANFIAEREWLKTLVRGGLKPMVWAAEIAFRFGLMALLFVMGLSGLVFVMSIRYLRQEPQR